MSRAKRVALTILSEILWWSGIVLATPGIGLILLGDAVMRLADRRHRALWP